MMDWMRNNRDVLLMVLIAIITFAITIPFVYQHLYYLDSTLYAMGMREFNLAKAHPYAPGYPLFIFFGNCFNLILKDHNLSLIAVSMTLGTIGIVVFYRFLSILFGVRTAFLGAIFMMTNQMFWFYRAVALNYTADLLAATVLYLGYIKYETTRNYRYLYAQFAAIGFIAGFRPTIILFMAPVLLYIGFLVIRESYQESGINSLGRPLLHVVLSGFALGFCVLCWLVPTMVLSGGVLEYIGLFNKQPGEGLDTTSILLGAPPAVALQQVKYLFSILKVLGVVLLPALIVAVICLVRYYLGDLRTRTDIMSGDGTKVYKRPRFTGIVIASITPPLLFYALVHFGQPGYTLILLPSVLLLGAYGIYALLKTRLGSIFAVVLVLMQVSLFIFPGTTTYPFRAFLYGSGNLSAGDRVLAGISPYMLYFNRSSIREDHARFELLFKELDREIKSHQPDEVLVLIKDYQTFQVGERVLMNEPLVGHLAYYYPAYPGVCLDGARKPKQITFKKSIRRFVIVTQGLDAKDVPVGMPFKKNRFTYVADAPAVTSFTLWGTDFIRER